MVGVLVLIHQHVAEAAPVVVQQRREGVEHPYGLGQQIVEVVGVGRPQPLGVLAVDGGHGLGEGLVGSGGLEGVGVDQLVLQRGDLVLDGARGEPLGVQVMHLGDRGDQPQRIRGIVDGEGGPAAQMRGLGAQDAYAGGVEGGDPHALSGGTHQTGDALLHLPGGLIGEGDRQDLVRAGHPGLQHVRDTPGQHTGLARACAGHDQQRTPMVQDRLPLLRVQSGRRVRRDRGCGRGLLQNSGAGVVGILAALSFLPTRSRAADGGAGTFRGRREDKIHDATSVGGAGDTTPPPAASAGRCGERGSAPQGWYGPTVASCAPSNRP